MKTYLDETEFNSIIENFVNDLDFDYSDHAGLKVEPIECRSRDGFIPHSHNYGGFDITSFTTWSTILGTGIDLCEGFGTDEAYKEDTEATENFWKYDLPEEYKTLAETIPESKRNYNDLNELGNGELAEVMDEYVREYIDTDPIHFGFRFMYEGANDEGIHTLCIHALAGACRYHGMNRGSTIETWEIEFKDAKTLEYTLNKIKDELESTF